MAEKQSLRDFQAQLAERFRTASSHNPASKLGFQAGGRHWLADLAEINEVVTVAGISPVPWAKPWFAGLASIRGTVYGCTDLAAFAGLAEVMPPGESRLLLVHPRYGINAALRMERALGLRNLSEMSAAARQGDDADWWKGRWHGADGTEWIELDMERLVASPAFLDAGA